MSDAMNSARKAKEALSTKKGASCSPSDTVRKASETALIAKTGSVLVLDGGKIVGLFTERDALHRVCAGGLDPGDTKVADVMTRSLKTAEPDDEVIVCVLEMLRGGFRNMPVVDGRGAPIGLLSMGDATEEEMADAFCLLRLEQESA